MLNTVKPVLRGHLWVIIVEYSKTCIKRAPLGNYCWIVKPVLRGHLWVIIIE